MKIQTVQTIRAMLLLLGTIVGAGIFAVPSMIGLWGVLPSVIAIAILTAMMTFVHLSYAEAILASREKGHLIGRATYWIGPWAGRLAGSVQTLQVFGSSLAYLILGGSFLSLLFPWIHASLFQWQMIFWCLGAIIVLCGLKMVSRAESILTWMLIGVVASISIIFAIRTPDWVAWLMPSSWNGFEPYGVFLFSLLGIVGMPEAASIVEYRRDSLRSSVIWSTLLAALLTCAYGVSAWTASIGTLGRDAADVIDFLPATLMFIVPLFGFLAVITSFISGSLDLKDLLQLDMRTPSFVAWAIALGVPLILLFVTPRDFLSTIGFVGSFFGAGIATMVIWMGAAAARKTRRFKNNGTMIFMTRILPWTITSVFVASGILWLVV